MNARLKNILHQPWLGGGVGTTLAILVGVVLLFSPIGKGLRDWSFDLPFLFRAEQRVNDVLIVYLDENTYEALNQDPANFDRAWHAKLVRLLQNLGARLVVFDVLFIDKGRPITQSDHDFAAAIKESGRVVLGAQFSQDEHLGIPKTTIVPPIDLFRDSAAAWGLVRVHRDTDFAARKILPGTDQIPSLAWKTAEASGRGIARRSQDQFDERWLNYYCAEPFAGISYSDVVSTNRLPPGFSFKDKIVFVGSGEVAGFTGEEKEQFRYPWTWISGHFPFGVEMHALTYANLARQDWMVRASALLQILFLLMCAVLGGYGLSAFRPLAATGLALGAALLIAAISIWIQNQFELWWAWLILVAAQIPAALGWSYLYNSVKSYLATRTLEVSLERYLPPQQVKQILKQPELLKPGAEQKTVSILFSDIAGFSKISERMHADDLVKLLNAYYETALTHIHETEGTVMNLVGDAIFAIWNAPYEQEDHQNRACRAALLLNEALIKFESGSLNLPLNTRIGLHTGTACVGNIGSSTRFAYAAVGESVNMASRLEGLNKQLGTKILATRDIQKSVEDKLVTRLVGHFRFKGLDQVVEVHEMVGLPGTEELSSAWRKSFAVALNRFQRKAFDEAEEGFRKTLKLHPSDGPSTFYLDRISHLRSSTLPSDWFGEVNLAEK